MHVALCHSINIDARRMTQKDMPTALITDYTKTAEGSLPMEERAKFTLNRLQRPVVAPKPNKQSGRGHVFVEQMKKLEEKQKQDMSIMEDLQVHATRL